MKKNILLFVVYLMTLTVTSKLMASNIVFNGESQLAEKKIELESAKAFLLQNLKNRQQAQAFLDQTEKEDVLNAKLIEIQNILNGLDLSKQTNGTFKSDTPEPY